MTENEQIRLEKINEKMAQMKAKQQAIVNREKDRERKTRTRRLIQNGALAEKYLNCDNMEPQEFEKILKTIAQMRRIRRILKIQKTVVKANRKKPKK